MVSPVRQQKAWHSSGVLSSPTSPMEPSARWPETCSTICTASTTRCVPMCACVYIYVYVIYVVCVCATPTNLLHLHLHLHLRHLPHLNWLCFLYCLYCQFHLDRNTGQLSRIIDRGSRSINFALSSMLFNVVPTALEVGLVSSILAYNFGPAYAAVALATIASYTTFTISVRYVYMCVFIRISPSHTRTSTRTNPFPTYIVIGELWFGRI